MPDYYTQISSFDVLNMALQNSANSVSPITTNKFKPQHMAFESGSDEYSVRMASIERDWNPGPAVITNFSELANRSAQEQSAILYHNTERDYSILSGNEMAERMRQEGATTLVAQELRGYQEAMDLQAQGYVDNINTALPREFVNLINTELAYSANASVIRVQEKMIGGLINAVA